MKTQLTKFGPGIFVCVFMALLSLFPQFYFQTKRGADFKGATFYYDYDEPIYAAYLQSLIDGSPRKNNVYENSNEPQSSESFLTIQFIPAYFVAIPSRIFGVSSDTAFLFVSAIFAFLAGFAVYWLLLLMTENPLLSTVGTLFILLLGTNVSGSNIVREVFGFSSSYFYPTFLRRYTPAVAFPFIFLLVGCVWLGLKSVKTTEKYFYALIIWLCFAVLAFSYFYYWTAILAWLVFLAGLYFIFQTENRNFSFWLAVFGGIILTIICYFLIVSNRNTTTDSTQILEHTRKIILLQPSIILGLLICLLAIFAVKIKLLEFKNQTTFFIFSLGLLPLLVFNQQIVTGYVLQPSHYGMYVVNYLNLFALVLLFGQIWGKNLPKLNRVILTVGGILLCIWGGLETYYSTKYRFAYNLRRDESYLMNRRLAEIGKWDINQAKSQITLSFDSVQADNQPTIAPQGVLWADHLPMSSNLTKKTRQKRYFLYLYLQGYTEKWLEYQLQKCPNETCRALIGWHLNPVLSVNSKEVEDVEINNLVTNYAEFVKNLTASDVYDSTISYLIVHNVLAFDYTNIDRWYQRDEGEKLGSFILYKLKPLKQGTNPPAINGN